MRENYLAEAFKDMDALNEDVFSLDDKGAEALQDFLDGDKGVDFISVIDTEAETEEDIQDSYLGKVILDCCVCHSKCYKDKEEVTLDENEEFANVGEECAYCHSKDGFKIVGEVTEFDSDETDEDEKDEDEDEKEVEIEKDSEEKFDDDVDSFDFEEKEEEKVEESLNFKKYLIMTHAGDAGIDEKTDYDTISDAKSRAKEFINDPYYDTVAIYNTESGKIIYLKGDYDFDIKKKSVSEEVSKTDDIDAEADDKKELDKKELDKKIDDADADRDYRLKKGITRRNESKIYKKIKEAKKCEGSECKDGECEEKKIDEAPSYELHPRYDSRQSFYGKARVDTGDKNDKNKLYSYDTLVAEMIDGKPVVYGTYSATTLRHIRDWLKQNGFKAENKAQIEADYMKEAKECKGKKCNIREGERRKGGCKLTEAKEYTAETLAKDIKDAVDWLVGEQEGCVTLKLDDKLAVCVGWSGGYGKEKRDDVIQSTEDPDYAINAGIKVWTSDDMRTDYDWINYPYYKNGDIEDTGLSLEADEDYTKAAEWLLGEYDRMSNYEISDDGEIVEETEETVEESKEPVTESVEEVKVTTETDEVNVKTEDGKVTVETQKREDETKKDEEVIEPISDEVKSEIVAGDEEEIDGEFGDEVEVDMDDFDEESFDELGESYFKSAYSNIDSYKTSCVKAEGKRMVIEGVIKFKSGKEKATSFVLESKEITKSGKSRFIGENMQICKGKKAFALNGTINGGRFISESFNYDYHTKDIKTGKSKRISGTVKKK